VASLFLSRLTVPILYFIIENRKRVVASNEESMLAGSSTAEA
jgi:hypothetical protein